jgi:hypothetical protein
MSLKTCPKCSKKLGTRTKVCKCGHAFATKSNHPLVPEPGGWVLDTYKGLPEIDPPAELTSGKLTVQQVYEQVSYEGLGFCIYHLIPAAKIKDAKLRKLWSDARAALGKIKEYLDDF